ncbi:MAG TPA: hypothetical protein VH502_13225 [Actinoplanes sp.]
MTTMYVDIAPVRIQQYLARTPRLRDRRGASAALEAATAETSLDEVLAGRARANPEAGDADGVVNLIVDDPTHTDAVIGDVLAHLRNRLPAAQFQATSAHAPDYVQAITAMRLQRESGEARTDHPTVAEFPFAAPCRLCRAAPAVDRVRLGPGDERAACADCTMRQSREVRREGTGAERTLSVALGLDTTPDDFAALAALGGTDTDRNHLATVYADGNGIGDFFARLADTAGKTRKAASKALSDHTRAALAHATRAVSRPDDEMLCVVPHVVGGDDILVSLPADRGWRFTRAFLADLCERLERTAADLDIPPPTVSAGIVFAHNSHPFHLVVEEAAAGLKRAKREVAGKAASVQAHDVTVDGVAGPRMPGLRLDTLQDAAADLDRLRAVPQSGRSQLAQALADGDGEVRALTLAKRLDREDVVKPFLATDSTASAINLGHALRIVRWWR